MNVTPGTSIERPKPPTPEGKGGVVNKVLNGKLQGKGVGVAVGKGIVNQNKNENWDKKLHDHSIVAPIKIKCLSPKKAKKLFLKRFKQLCGEIYITEGVVIDGKRPKLKY